MTWEATPPVTSTPTDDWTYENLRRLEETLREEPPGMALQKDGVEVLEKVNTLNITGTATVTKTGDNSADVNIEGGSGGTVVNEFTEITGKGTVLDNGIVVSDLLTDAEGRKYYLVVAPKNLRSRQVMGLYGLAEPSADADVPGPLQDPADGRLFTLAAQRPPLSTYDYSSIFSDTGVFRTTAPDGSPLVGGPYEYSIVTGCPAAREIERLNQVTGKDWYIPGEDEIGIALNNWPNLDALDTTPGDLSFAAIEDLVDTPYVGDIMTSSLEEGSSAPSYNYRYGGLASAEVRFPGTSNRTVIPDSDGWATRGSNSRVGNPILVAVRRVYSSDIPSVIGGAIDLGNGRYMKAGRHVVPAGSFLTVPYSGSPLTEAWSATATALNSVNVPNMPAPTCDPFLGTITLYNNFEHDAVTIAYQVVGTGDAL